MSSPYEGNKLEDKELRSTKEASGGEKVVEGRQKEIEEMQDEIKKIDRRLKGKEIVIEGRGWKEEERQTAIQQRENLQKEKGVLELRISIEEQNATIEDLLKQTENYKIQIKEKDKKNQLLKKEIGTLRGMLEMLGPKGIAKNWWEALKIVQKQEEIIKKMTEKIKIFEEEKQEKIKNQIGGPGKGKGDIETKKEAMEKLKIEEIIEILGNKKNIKELAKLQKEIFEGFDDIDNNAEISDEEKLQEKGYFVKTILLFELEKRNKRLKKEGLNDERIEKIKEKLIGQSEAITDFFIEGNKVNKQRKKNKKESERLDGEKKNIGNQRDKLMKGKVSGIVKYFNKIVNDFERAINSVYDDKTIKTKEEAKERINETVRQHRERDKNVHFGLSDKAPVKQERIKTLFDNIEASIEKKWLLEKIEEELEERKRKSIKTLTRKMLGYEVDNNTIELMRGIFSGKVDKKVLEEATKEKSEKEKIT